MAGRDLRRPGAALEQRQQSQDSASGRPGPGKRSLTEDLEPDTSVGGGTVDGELAPRKETPASVAAMDTAGPGQPLPHLDRIQALFGRHTLASVRAHTDSAAGDAASKLGARAFTSGDQIAFAVEPDLHTAAHEAAHVVQQRAGVALKDEVGASGDMYEIHADAVADLVVAGQSAESKLDELAGQGGHAGPSQAVVQRKEAGAPSSASGSMPPWDYVERHREATMTAISERIARTGLPQPHARLPWASPERAAMTAGVMMRRYAESAPGLTLKRLMGLAYPADLLQVVTQARNERTNAEWIPEVGRAIAEALDVPIVESIQRMGMRLRVQLDGDPHGVMPPGHTLIASCPLDGLIADLLVSPDMVTSRPAAAGAANDTPGKPFAHGAVEVEYEWLGAHDPQLWNWIKVTSPKNATAEHVARTPLIGGEVPEGSEQAYRIAASPPYFGIPFETARRVPAAWKFAPEPIKSGPGANEPGPRVADGSALAGSSVADDAALAQVGVTEKSDLSAERLLDRASQQLAFLKDRLAPWHAHLELGALQSFLLRRADQFQHDPHAAQRWAGVLASTERTLFAATADVRQIVDDLAARGATPEHAAALEPVLQVLRAYARAAGLAHLAAQAPAALAEARQLRRMLPIALAEDRIRVARGAVADQRDAAHDAPEIAPEWVAPGATLPDLSTRAADLRLRAARGEPVDIDGADALAVDADETAVRAQIAQLQAQLIKVEHRANEVKLSVTNPGGWTVQRTTQRLREESRSWLAQLDRARDPHRTEGAANVSTSKGAATDGARRTVATVRHEMTSFQEQAEIAEFLKYAYERIADQQLRDALNSMALQIGIMIATGEIAGAGVAAIRGIEIARDIAVLGEVIEDVRKVRLGYSALEVLGQAGMATGAQGLTGGRADTGAFVENVAGIALTTAALKPFEGLLGDTAEVERELHTWAGAAKAGARTAVGAPVEVGVGIMAAGTAHAVTTGQTPADTTSGDIVSQGIALVASKFVHRHMQELRTRITRALSGEDRAAQQALLQQIQALEGAAAIASARPTVARARELLAEHAIVLGREADLYHATPGKTLPPAQHQAAAQNAADQARLQGAFIETAFHLCGLRPVVDGAVFEGTPAEIEAAFAQADRSGMPPSRMRRAETREWVVVSGDRTYKVHEIGIVLAGDDAAVRAAARRVPPKPGYIDVVVHASADSFWVVRDGIDIAIDHRALAGYIRSKGTQGLKIRLLACNSGASELAVAQHLANKLGVEVLAPTKTVWIDPTGKVGVGVANVDDGLWRELKPQREPPKKLPNKEPYREPPELRTPDGSEVEPPLHVQDPVVDNRARIRAEDLPSLSARLGVHVIQDPWLANGVQIRATPRRGLLGYDLSTVEIRVGANAVMSDVMRHADIVNTLRRDNSLLGKLRQLAERLHLPAGGGAAGAASTRSAPSRFPPGTRGYVTETELAKLGNMIDDRHAQHRDGLIDQQTLDDEVRFLEGQLAFHTETLQSMADAGYVTDPSIAVHAPDTGTVTREAQAAGYQLPGEQPGLAGRANPEHYYYRRSSADPSQFELVRKPTAPADAPGYRAVVSGGRFSRLVELTDIGTAPREVVPPDWTKEQVIARVRETSLGPYAEMLQRHGIATRAVVDAAITTARGRRNQAGTEVTLEDLRSDVKQQFRDRVVAKLIDPRLDETASYRNMQAMLEGLNNADRGALVQMWYTRRKAPVGQSEVKYQIPRTSGPNRGKVETRVADLIVNGEIREIKDVAGSIDEDQFGAYEDLLLDRVVSAQLHVSRLRYVFIRPEGVLANFDLLADKLAGPMKGRFSIEVINNRGQSLVVTTIGELSALKRRLRDL